VSLISQTHIDSYDRDGTVRVEQAFGDWVSSLSEAVRDTIAGHRAGDPRFRGTRSTTQNEMSVIDSFGGGVMALNMVPHEPIFARWLADSPAAEMAAAIMQSRVARYWIDATFIKDQPGASEGTPWHNDTCTWPFWGRQMAILWIALTDIGLDDAPLTTVRGTHEGDGRYYSTFFEPTDSPPPPYKPWSELVAKAEAPGAEIQTWTMRAGDCLFMHPSTIHGSRARGSGGRERLAFSTRWLGDDAVYRPDPLTERMAAPFKDDPRMTHGAPPPDDVLPPSWPR
jgi:ectoine hydroxylase-related dioxygenase (phytanoyl-CoA dioxygenase family)